MSGGARVGGGARGAGWLSVACLVVAVGCTAKTHEDSPPLAVAAAADLTDAFGAIGRAFETDGGPEVRLSFGSSGLLAQQIAAGAPFDLFASANVEFVDALIADGHCDPATKQPLARGRLAVWTRRGSVGALRDLEELADPCFGRIAIAHPEHAPYGQAAMEAFASIGLPSTRLVYGENVRQALQFAETGNVDAAVVALALVASDDVNPWVLVEEHHHGPIDQILVVCGGGRNPAGARAFAAFVRSPSGRETMARYGFSFPEGGTR